MIKTWTELCLWDILRAVLKEMGNILKTQKGQLNRVINSLYFLDSEHLKIIQNMLPKMISDLKELEKNGA